MENYTWISIFPQNESIIYFFTFAFGSPLNYKGRMPNAFKTGLSQEQIFQGCGTAVLAYIFLKIWAYS